MVALIGAMAVEIVGIEERMTDTETVSIGTLKATSGKLGDKEVVVCCCGIGKVNAAVATVFLLDHFPQVELVINLGVAGGIDPGMRQGDIVVAQSVTQHDYDQTPSGFPLGQVDGFLSRYFTAQPTAVARMEDVLTKLGFRFRVGVIASGDQFISSKERAREIHREFGALACEMETGAIAQACAIYSVPFLGIRSISDNADGSAVEDFHDFVVQASERSICAVMAFLAD